MGNYFDLIAAINAAIKTNGEQGITGASLNAILRDMVAALGAGYQYVGVVAPDAAAPSTDYNAVYLGLTAGTYTNFGGTQVRGGQFGVFTFNGSWTYNVADIASGGYVRYDVPQVMTQEQAAQARFNIAAASNADVNAKYTKPDSGIPATDLAQAVQTSLGKADVALPASSVVDNLTTEDATKALSAKQGKVLGDNISQLGQKVYKSTAAIYPNINKRLDAAGALGSVGGYETSDFYPLDGVFSIKIKASITSTSLAIAYYSAASESAFISGINSNLDTTIPSSAFPVGATHIRVSSVRANEHYCNLFYSKTVAEEANENVAALSSIVDKNGKLLLQIFGSSESITPATQRDNYLISGDGSIIAFTNYKVTEPVKMLKGQKVTVESYTPNNGCQLAITDATGISYTPVILNTTGGGRVITNTYIAPADCYVAVSYLSTQTFSMSIAAAIDLYTTKTILDALSNPDTTAIEYLNPDVEFVPKFIQAKKKSNGVAPLVLAMFTDIHGGAAVNLPRIISFCGRHATRIDDIYSLGDMVADKFSDTFVWPDVAGAENILNIIGNHDTANYTPGIGYDWLAHIGLDAYNKFIAPFVINWGVTQPLNAAENGYCYYYKDYATQKTRVIFLDVMAYDSTEEAWLAATLADAKTNNLSVLVVGHNPSASVTGFNCNYGSLKQNSASLATYQPNITGATSVIESFISSGGKFISWVCGHYHRDIIGKLNETNQLCLLLDNANFGQFAASEMYDKIEGNRTQDSITFITIDTEGKTISAFKAGCRVDRWLRDRSSICIDYSSGEILCES